MLQALQATLRQIIIEFQIEGHAGPSSFRTGYESER
jgi:hypothetical protein